MSIKIAYIKGDGEPRELKGNWTWDQLAPLEHDCYNTSRVHIPNSAAIIHGWKCDYYENFSHISDPREVLKPYDIIITLKSFLHNVSKFRSDQIWLNYECEPYSSHGWSLDDIPNIPGLDELNPNQSQYVASTRIGDLYTSNIPYPYDAFLNPFIPPEECSKYFIQTLNALHPDIPTTYNNKNIPYPVVWSLDVARKYIDANYTGDMTFKELFDSKPKCKIWITCRTLKFHTSPHNFDLDFAGGGKPRTITNDQIDMSMLDSSYEYIFERTRPWSHEEYYANSGTCKYQINLDDSITPGMLIGDAACLGVICFAKKDKWMHNMLYPDYCQVTSLQEAFEKINEVERDSALRDNIMSHIQQQLHYIDHRQARKYLFEHVLGALI